MASEDLGALDSNGGPATRVVLADDSYIVREAIDHVLSDAEGVEVLAACSDQESLLRAIVMRTPPPNAGTPVCTFLVGAGQSAARTVTNPGGSPMARVMHAPRGVGGS